MPSSVLAEDTVGRASATGKSRRSRIVVAYRNPHGQGTALEETAISA
jgi:hypothetical protein